MADSGLTREFLAERDARIFSMRRAGVPVSELARRFGITTAAVNAGIKRQLEKLNREALLAYPEILRMELERLDALQQSVWPLTQHRIIKLDDGTEIQAEPDLKAVAEVRAIMAARAKLLGMEQTNVNLQVEEISPQRAVLAGSTKPTEENIFDPEQEARQLLQVMSAAGILSPDIMAGLLGTPLELETGDTDDRQPGSSDAPRSITTNPDSPEEHWD